MKTRVIQDDPDEPTTSDDLVDRTAEPKPPNNLAARMGRWSAHHRKIAIFGWFGFVVIAVLIGMRAGTIELKNHDAIPGEAGRATRLIDKEFGPRASETVLVQSATLNSTDRPFRAAVGGVVETLRPFPIVSKIDSPYTRGNGDQISQDGHSALVNFEFKSSQQDAMKISKPVEDAVAGVQKAHPELTIAEFGDGSSAREVEGQFTKDLAKAGLLSLPVTLIILLIAFGALVAAGIPLLLALTSVVATMFLIALPSHLMPVDAQVKEVILLIGLAVGVDYSLFYLKREREERAAGRSESAALEAAAATSGRSVLISGFTVMIAMAGMFFAGDPSFSSFALATIIVVAIAMLGSLTVLPAVLSKLGDRVEKGRVPFLRRLKRDDDESGVWSWILDRVLARPALSVLIAGGVLVAIAIPAIGMKTVQITPEALPQNLKAVQTYNRIDKAFPSELHTATVVLKAENMNAPETRAAVADLRRRAAATVVPEGSIATDVNAQRTAVKLTVPLAGNGSNALSEAGVTSLRDEIVPATFGTLADVEYGVTGGTAIEMDSRSAMKESAPMVFAFVLVFAFILLLVSFRSVVIAAKAVILNLLSVAAAYGVLVLVFQHGWGKGLIGFDYTGGITAFLPIFLFVILFGLSMDYHVFIISRVREARDRGLSTEEAVAHGIKTTAGVVTSAALVMVCVFAVFATGSIILLQQLGVGLAAAVLIDATVIRAVLLPASMTLLGDWNWYLPSWLEWLPRLEHEEQVEKPKPPKTPRAFEPTA
jgi:RND superfamily putative drug exporter